MSRRLRMPAATASALTALTALVAACVLPAFVGTALRPIGLERRKVNWETPRLPKVRRNAGNFEVIDAVLKSTPDVEAEVESRDPKLMRWKVVWKVAQTAEVPAGQFGYQVMLQQTDKNKEYFSLQSAFRRPSALQPGDALIFANQWNSLTPFAHIYVSQDYNLRLEMDVDFKWLGSSPGERVKEMISTFSELILALAARCRDVGPAPSAPSG